MWGMIRMGGDKAPSIPRPESGEIPEGLPKSYINWLLPGSDGKISMER